MSLRGSVRLVLAALGTVLLTVSDSAAQGEIQNVRIGRHAEYDRLVFELGPQPVQVYQTNEAEFQLEFDATPPRLSPAQERSLSALGVRIESTGRGTGITLDRDRRPWVAFRLPSNPGAPNPSERIVLDLGKGDAAPLVPADALSLPVNRTRVAAREAAAPSPTTPPVETRPRGEGLQEALRAAPPAPPAGAEAPAPVAAPVPSEVAMPQVAVAGAEDEQVWVHVKAIDFFDLPAGGPSREDLLDLELSVITAPNGDLLAQRDGLAGQRIRLRELTRDAGANRRVAGSLLQKIVERIADAYEEYGQYGTRIDIRTEDLERLLREEDGSLRIHVAEAEG